MQVDMTKQHQSSTDAKTAENEARVFEPMGPQDVLNWLPHRYPFLLLDRVTHIEAGKQATGIKCVTHNEPFFPGHFPGNPVMPGVLMLEALAQLSCVLTFWTAGAYKGQKVYLIGFDDTRFRRMVVPGDVLDMRTEVRRTRRHVWKYDAKAFVDGELAVESHITAGLEDWAG